MTQELKCPACVACERLGLKAGDPAVDIVHDLTDHVLEFSRLCNEAEKIGFGLKAAGLQIYAALTEVMASAESQVSTHH